MNPYHVYQQQQSLAWTRIDMLLALYDGAIDRLERARERLEAGDYSTAAPWLLRGAQIVSELLAGLDLRYGEIPHNLLSIYSFALRQISTRDPAAIRDAIEVLGILRGALAAIRTEAEALERSGQIPPIHAIEAVRATA